MKVALYLLPNGIAILIGVVVTNVCLTLFKGGNRELLVALRYSIVFVI